MYFPSSEPSTRLSLTTTDVPVQPVHPVSPYPKPKQKTKRHANRVSQLLGELSEEDGVMGIVKGPEYFIVLCPSEFSVWKHTTCLAKLVRSDHSLRTHGANVRMAFLSPTDIVLVTEENFTFFYELSTESVPAYRLSERFRGWPAGASEARPLQQVNIVSRGARELPVGEGIPAIAASASTLFVCVADPPCLRLYPRNQAAQSVSLSTLSLAEHAVNNSANSIAILSDWDWLVDRSVFIRQLLLVSAGPTSSTLAIVTSDGRAYMVRCVATQNKPDSRGRDAVGSMFGSRSGSRGDLFSPHVAPGSPAPHSAPGSPRGAPGESATYTPHTPRSYTPHSPHSPHAFTHTFSPLNSFSTTRILNGSPHTPPAVDYTFTGTCFHATPDATEIALNIPMGLISVGTRTGLVHNYSLATRQLSHTFDLKRTLNTAATALETGEVTSLAWTADGAALATGWARGWAVWSTFGRLGTYALAGSLATGYGVEGEQGDAFEDHFMHGVSTLFWGAGGFSLFVLAPPPPHPKQRAGDEQLFVVPFVRSAAATLHTPDNTRHAFLQTSDAVLVYRGADQPDLSVINPESDVWQTIKVPSSYLALQAPLRLAAISHDARLIAVAGTHGLAHYNAVSGRWKLFESELEEDAIRVLGLAWWSNVLVAGCVEAGAFQLRFFSRDHPLTLSDAVHTVFLDAEPLVLSVVDSSLLVYTGDNTLHHFLMELTESLKVTPCGRIGFEGIVTNPRHIRGVSWLVPKSQLRLGDPADDLNVATLIFFQYGRLVLLRPRKLASREVKYDLQIIAERIEFYWTHSTGIGTLENSLWGWDGQRVRIWLDALTIEGGVTLASEASHPEEADGVTVTSETNHQEEGSLRHRTEGGGPSSLTPNHSNTLHTPPRHSAPFTLPHPSTPSSPSPIITPPPIYESVAIPLDFYPLSVLMEKGIVVGVSEETFVRKNLDFALFRIVTTTHLFIHHIVRFHIERGQSQEAVRFAAHYQHLVYFSHVLEILLHNVLEEECDARAENGAVLLPQVIAFLDHFDECLQVVAGCARKSEMARWEYLFSVTGKPRDLFEKCISRGYLRVAASYLLVLHTLDTLQQSSTDTVRLLKACIAAEEWDLCKELMRFLYSLDRTGTILRTVVGQNLANSPLSPINSLANAIKLL